MSLDGEGDLRCCVAADIVSAAVAGEGARTPAKYVKLFDTL